jgi:galactitol-specific phosphotransferase system IIB component
LEKCAQINEELLLPSGCHLIRVNLSSKLFECLLKELGEGTSTEAISINEHKSKTDEDELEMSSSKQSDESEADHSDKELDNELKMDTLPEAVRFTTQAHISKLSALNTLINNKIEQHLDDDFFDENIEHANSTTIDTEKHPGNDIMTTTSLGIYVQRNSRLKLVLILLDTNKQHYKQDATVRIVIYFFLFKKKIMVHSTFFIDLVAKCGN